MVTFTKGSQTGVLGTIYDRLRKRSLRRYYSAGSSLVAHEAYVRGLRDALAAVQAEVGEGDL